MKPRVVMEALRMLNSSWMVFWASESMISSHYPRTISMAAIWAITLAPVLITATFAEMRLESSKVFTAYFDAVSAVSQ